MLRHASGLKLATTTIALVIVIGAETRSGAQQQQKKTQWDGVDTAQQAERGKSLYNAECAGCHTIDPNAPPAIDVNGRPDSRRIVPLNDRYFWANWSGITLDQLLNRIQISMPAAAPGTLNRAQVADIIAFLLEVEGAQAGSGDLPAAAAELRNIRFADPIPPAR